MLNVLVPITNNAEKFQKLLSQLGGDEQICIRIGITKSQASNFSIVENENISIFEFEDSSKREEILNSLSENLQVGEILVLRKPISFEEFQKFCACREDIAVCKENRSKVGGFFHRLWQRILKTVLGVKLYEGDTSVIKFNENIGAVLTQTNDFSYATRVDRWKGLTTEAIETKEIPVKAEKDKKSIIMCSIVAVVALIIGLATTLCISLLMKVNIMGGLLLFCLDAICFAIMLIMFIMIGFNCKVGKKHNKNAEII